MKKIRYMANICGETVEVDIVDKVGISEFLTLVEVKVKNDNCGVTHTLFDTELTVMEDGNG